MDLYKVQKQGLDENKQETTILYRTMAEKKGKKTTLHLMQQV